MTTLPAPLSALLGRAESGPPAPEGSLLAVRGLSIAYGRSVVVRDVSLQAAPGEVVCVMGRNGAGKTTLLKSIIGVLPAQRGQVYFEDENQPGIEQDSYGLLNLRLGWRFNQHWDLGLWGNNLTNEEYLIDAGNTGLLFGIPTVIPGPDRSYGVTLRAKF